MKKIKKIFFHSPIKYVVLLVISLVITSLYIIARGSSMTSLSDAFFLAGAVIFFTGMLYLTSYYGAFDTFNYGLSRIGKKRYKDLYEYTVIKNEKRKEKNYPYIPFLVIGIFFIMISCIFLFFR